MDPFLEEPAGWHGFHTRFIVALSDYLAERVSPDFIVRIEERVEILAPDDLISYAPVPDLTIVRGPTSSGSKPAEAISEPVLIEPIQEQEIRQRYIDIRENRGSKEIVATIEMLSPYNKAPGTQGRKDFLKKRELVTASNAHWIEIDLLRAGERPREVSAKSDYYALLKRAKPSAPFEVWFFNLRDTMPTIAVPLRPPHSDVALNLQTAFDTVYDRGRYADSTDYAMDVPLPRLSPADLQWTKQRVAMRNQRVDPR